MHAAVLISLKDLRQRLRDRSAILFAVVAPLGLSIIFSVVFGGVFEGELDLRLGVVVADDGPLGTTFATSVLPGVADAGLATITTFDDEDAARSAVEDGSLTAAFVVPAGFSEAVTSGGAPRIEVLGSADAQVGTQVATAIADAYAAELRAVQLGVAVAGGPGVGPADAARLADAVRAQAPPIAVGQVEAARRELDGVTYLSAGMAVFFLFFTVQFGVTSLLEERREGTLQRLLAAPVPRAAVYGGKVLTSLLLGLASMAVLLVSSALLIGARWGDPVGVALLVLTGVLAATAVMAAIGTAARTAEQASTWQSVVAVVLGMLGGAFFPVTQVSPWLGRLSLLTPHQWFLRGLSDLAGGAGPAAALPAAGAMLAFALVGFGLASLLGRREARA